jgi:dihydroflavonol-4-reductase
MILVTGASGLVGQHLISSLSKEGHRVRALYHHKKPSLYVPVDAANVEWMASDLLNISMLEDAFEDIHQVYHCAAKVSYDPRYFDEMIHTNVEGTANIVNLCLDQKQIKLCHVSSISTLGEAKANEVLLNRASVMYLPFNRRIAQVSMMPKWKYGGVLQKD